MENRALVPNVGKPLGTSGGFGSNAHSPRVTMEMPCLVLYIVPCSDQFCWLGCV